MRIHVPIKRRGMGLAIPNKLVEKNKEEAIFEAIFRPLQEGESYQNMVSTDKKIIFFIEQRDGVIYITTSEWVLLFWDLT